ncbi:MAG: type II toxin-antitoxin system VapC family toxin [Promethearchaeota archaeon]
MLIDANIFLEVQLNQEKAPAAAGILKAVLQKDVEGYITDFTIDSIIIILEHYGKSPSEIKRFLLSLLAYKGLEIYQLSIFDKIEATDHMVSLGLDFDDACLYQAMKVLNLSRIASFDSDFDKIPDILRLTSIQ